MSNCWLNVRFGLHHLQIGGQHWWSVRVSRNDYHVDNPKRFEIHQLDAPWR